MLSYFLSFILIIALIVIFLKVIKFIFSVINNLYISYKVYKYNKANEREYRKYLKYKKKFLEKYKKNAISTGIEGRDDLVGHDYEIIGVVNPYESKGDGKWQQFVLYQKLGFLQAFKQAIEEDSKEDKKSRYWQLVVKAGKIMRGSGKGRGV